MRIFVEVRSSQVLSATKMYNGTLRGADKTESKEIRQKDHNYWESNILWDTVVSKLKDDLVVAFTPENPLMVITICG